MQSGDLCVLDRAGITAVMVVVMAPTTSDQGFLYTLARKRKYYK